MRVYSNPDFESIVDGDGQFVLMEANESLPSWCTPSSCANRVLLHKKEWHLIPPTHSPVFTTILESPTITRFPQLDVVVNRRTSLFSDNRVCIFNHSQSTQSQNQWRPFWVFCMVPFELAACLHMDPFIVTKLVQNFITSNRHPIPVPSPILNRLIALVFDCSAGGKKERGCRC